MKLSTQKSVRYALIEDEYFTAESIKRMIGQIRSDYQLVAEAATIDEAQQAIAETKPDLVISDIHLADGVANELLQSLSIPLIIFTAYDQYRKLFQQPPLMDYVLKPICENDVEQALSRYEQYKNNNIY